LYLQQNRGVSATLNWAIRSHSTGKYLAGCASDDFLLPDRIEKQVAFMESHPEFAMVCGNVKVVDADSRVVDGFRIIDPVTNPAEDLKFESLIERNCIAAMTVMLRREVWDECGGYNEETPLEDYDMWLKVAYSHRIVYIDDFFACYRWHGENVTANVQKMAYSVWAIVSSWIDRMKPDFARKVLARRAAVSFNQLSRAHKKEALRFLRKTPLVFDSFVIQNWLKGWIKLLFCHNKTNGMWK